MALSQNPSAPVPQAPPQARPASTKVPPTPDAANESATVDEPSGAAAVRLSFWQHPFVQNVMPFLTSLLVHAAVILIGIFTAKVVQQVVSKIKDQIIIPEAVMADQQAGGIPHPGADGDKDRDVGQDKFPDVKPDAQGLSDKASKDLTGAMGGGAADAASDGISVGANSLIGGVGHSSGAGKGDGNGSGSGDGGGLAPFGVPGGGNGIGPKSSFVGTGGNARKIMFVCDATGSMMSKFDLLRVELRKAIQMLRMPQSFNVVFFQENAKPPLEKTLMLATPDTQRRAYDYIDNYAARGPTDPIPALKIALDMKAELMYFLIDPSDFPDKPAVLELFRKANADHKMKVNTIAFIDKDPEDEKFLKQLATENGGQFKYVSEDDLGK